MQNKDNDIRRYINSKYRKILKRDVDSSGMITFFNAIKTGSILPIELESHLIGSEEYKSRFGILTPVESVTSSLKNNSVQGLTIEGAKGTSDGYGICAETIATAISAKTDLSFHSRYNHKVNEGSNILNKTKGSNGRSKINLFILPLYNDILGGGEILLPGPKRRDGSKKILISMFETDSLPRAWHDRFAQFDGIIFPSKFCQSVYIEQSNLIPSFYNPIGIRTDIYKPLVRISPLNRRFRFLTYFSNHLIDDDRKNVAATIYAFKRKFEHNKDVELIVKTTDSSVLNIIGGIPSNIIIKREQIDRAGILSLLRTSDCFVFPSRGEGYGLPPREAIATGMPTIITDYSALSDIADPSISFAIKPSNLVTARFDQSIANAHNYGNMVFGRWADIEIDDLAEQMVRVYQNYNSALEIAKNGADFIHNKEGHMICGNQLLSIIDKI
jgi:glycosyltransferase involved in cell wall biosynthesis